MPYDLMICAVSLCTHLDRIALPCLYLSFSIPNPDHRRSTLYRWKPCADHSTHSSGYNVLNLACSGGPHDNRQGETFKLIIKMTRNVTRTGYPPNCRVANEQEKPLYPTVYFSFINTFLKTLQSATSAILQYFHFTCPALSDVVLFQI